jgi:succinate dehydrogenase / fumarate reductase flavoprotein subunit
MVRFARETSAKLPAAESALASARSSWESRFKKLAAMNGPENPHILTEELGEWMTDNVTVVRQNDRLRSTLEKIEELADRWTRCGLIDSSSFANRELSYLNQFENMLDLARVMTKGALLRDESRGAHFKVKDLEVALEGDNVMPRDDANFLKTTIAEYTPEGPKISYRPVDVSEIPPRQRKY